MVQLQGGDEGEEEDGEADEVGVVVAEPETEEGEFGDEFSVTVAQDAGAVPPPGVGEVAAEGVEGTDGIGEEKEENGEGSGAGGAGIVGEEEGSGGVGEGAGEGEEGDLTEVVCEAGGGAEEEGEEGEHLVAFGVVGGGGAAKPGVGDGRGMGGHGGAHPHEVHGLFGVGDAGGGGADAGPEEEGGDEDEEGGTECFAVRKKRCGREAGPAEGGEGEDEEAHPGGVEGEEAGAPEELGGEEVDEDAAGEGEACAAVGKSGEEAGGAGPEGDCEEEEPGAPKQGGEKPEGLGGVHGWRRCRAARPAKAGSSGSRAPMTRRVWPGRRSGGAG